MLPTGEFLLSRIIAKIPSKKYSVEAPHLFKVGSREIGRFSQKTFSNFFERSFSVLQSTSLLTSPRLLNLTKVIRNNQSRLNTTQHLRKSALFSHMLNVEISQFDIYSCVQARRCLSWRTGSTTILPFGPIRKSSIRTGSRPRTQPDDILTPTSHSQLDRETASDKSLPPWRRKSFSRVYFAPTK